MQSFRASPWVSYEPSLLTEQDRDQRVSGRDLDKDIEMDAPHISVLKDEEESPPPSSHQKLVTTSKKCTATSWAHGSAEDEADQLIDELDEEENGGAQPSRPTDAAQKRKASTKRKPRKGDKPSVLSPTVSIFKANPDSLTNMEIPDISMVPIAAATEHPVPKGRKRARSPNKTLSVGRAKGKVAKPTSAVPHLLIEDAGVLSESYAGTAASSPITASAACDLNSPEPDIFPPSSPPPSSMPLVEESPNLETVPIPVYPLPTKPFPVQPPPKIPTGFAPQMPVDKSSRKVRRWREANREIRGIAGGRWFARTWAGEKESDFITHHLVAKSVDDKVSSTNISATKATSNSISSPATSKTINKLKASSKSASLANSANASRATSTAPDTVSHQGTSNVRAPTKMRISQQAPSEADGDSVS